MNTITSWTSSETSAINKQDMHTCGWTPDVPPLKEIVTNILEREVIAGDCQKEFEKYTVFLDYNDNRVTLVLAEDVSLNEELQQTYETNKSAAESVFNKLQELFEKYNLESTVITYTDKNELGGPRYEFHILAEVWNGYSDKDERVQFEVTIHRGTISRLRQVLKRNIFH